MTKYTSVLFNEELLQAVLEGARRLYPKETVMLLRGEKRKDMIVVKDLVIPPLADYGQGFAKIPIHMLPIDFSIVGTLHSHPSGNLTPSHTDLNHFFGTVLIIAAHPFVDERNLASYGRDGSKLTLKVIKTKL